MALRIVAVLFGVVVMTVSSAIMSSTVGTGQASPVPAKLLGFERDSESLAFHVISNGCTQKEHFQLVFSTHKDFSTLSDVDALTGTVEKVYIRLMRIKPDKCRRAPMKYSVKFSVASIAHMQSVQIMNEFVRLPSMQRG